MFARDAQIALFHLSASNVERKRNTIVIDEDLDVTVSACQLSGKLCRVFDLFLFPATGRLIQIIEANHHDFQANKFAEVEYPMTNFYTRDDT